MKRMGYGLLFLLVAILMPALIWVALIAGVRQPASRRILRAVAAKGEGDMSLMVCRFDSDCPPGYVCVDRRCVPAR